MSLRKEFPAQFRFVLIQYQLWEYSESRKSIWAKYIVSLNVFCIISLTLPLEDLLLRGWTRASFFFSTTVSSMFMNWRRQSVCRYIHRGKVYAIVKSYKAILYFSYPVVWRNALPDTMHLDTQRILITFILIEWYGWSTLLCAICRHFSNKVSSRQIIFQCIGCDSVHFLPEAQSKHSPWTQSIDASCTHIVKWLLSSNP